MVESVGAFETSVCFSEITRRDISEDSHPLQTMQFFFHRHFTSLPDALRPCYEESDAMCVADSLRGSLMFVNGRRIIVEGPGSRDGAS